MKGHEILLERLEAIRPFLQAGSINEESIEFIKKILDGIPFFTSLIYKNHIQQVQRVTINKRLPGNNNDRLSSTAFLKNPPAQAVTRYGRLNSIGQSVLYATFDPITALSEMRPEAGDLITISTWKANPGCDLNISAVFRNTSLDGDVHNELSLRLSILYRKFLKEHDEETALQFDILIKFIADFFAKSVDDNNHLDYFISAHYANKIFNEFENGEVEAIIYPSVRQNLTLSNIAIKPDVFNQYYSLIEVEESVVIATPQNGGWWQMEGTGQSKSFTNGFINW